MSEKLVKFLDAASEAYYAGCPIINDDQFDNLADSINYNKVGSKQHEDIFVHTFPMYSLQKFYEDTGKTSPLASEKNVCMSPKLDGAAIAITYMHGELLRVLTRGDGTEGRDITNKFINSKLIPQKINTTEPIVQVTGEICAPKSVENSRNYAAGALNLKDLEEFKTRSIEFFAYGILPFTSSTFDEDMAFLRRQGFSSVQDANLDQIYPTDGVVFRVNSNARFNELGYTASFPRGSYALKERAEVVETTIKAVEWDVGRSGRVTPVAILEPIMIGDAKVSRATLNNPGFIEALGLCIGDKVAVRRAGMIIPEIAYKVE